ncbi:NAD(P)H-binding protein [Streptomyces parvulus]|uniref:NAD(P)H-binding protein n=1 Tax=Streptomyces parvulus TaxID=146923 RepID=UPI0033DF2794
MILVTGATGVVGREVVRGLAGVSVAGGAGVRVMVRDVARLGVVAGGVEVVRGDFGDAVSLGEALRGVERAFLLTVGVGGGDDERFLRAARAAGVGHVVKVSAAAVADGGADDAVTRWQRGAEGLLRESGLGWTVLRPRSFMSNALAWAGSVVSEGVVRGLYGGSVNACVDPRDVAAVAVCALTERGHLGRVHTVTGPRAVSAVEQTTVLGRVLGRRLRFEELSLAGARRALARRYPGEVVEALLAGAERQRAGAKAGVQDTVRRVTGRAPRSFAQWAADHREAFAGLS